MPFQHARAPQPFKPRMIETTDLLSARLDEPQHVTQPAQIAGILRRLQDAHALVRVSLPGEGEAWLSAILEVHPAHGHLLIDELTPRDGNALMTRARRVIVNAQIQGVDISFAANLIDIGVSDGAAFYRLALPESVRYWQRRASYRVRVSAATLIPVTLQHDNGRSLAGELYDISVGGIGTRHTSAKALPLLGEVWSDCCISLPATPQLRCALEIRYVGQDARASQLRLGGRFVDISRAQLKAVENYIAHLEREQLRRRRRTRDA